MIHAVHISKQFDGRTVLDDISVEFQTGSTNLIIGRSGSGKTVLLKTLVGLHEPDEGSVWYDDRNFTALGFHERKAIRHADKMPQKPRRHGRDEGNQGRGRSRGRK